MTVTKNFFNFPLGYVEFWELFANPAQRHKECYAIECSRQLLRLPSFAGQSAVKTYCWHNIYMINLTCLNSRRGRRRRGFSAYLRHEASFEDGPASFVCSWGLHMRRFSTRVCLEFNLLQSCQRFSVWFDIQLQLRFFICSGRLQSREHCIIDSKTLRVCQVEVVRAVNAGKQGAPRLCQIWHLEQDISHLFYFMYRSFLLWARNLVDSRGRVFLGHASVSCLKARPQLWKRFACKFLFSSPDGWGIHRPCQLLFAHIQLWMFAVSNSKLATMTVDTPGPTWVVTLKRPTENGKMRPLFSWINYLNSCDKTNILLKSNKLSQTLLTLTKPF